VYERKENIKVMESNELREEERKNGYTEQKLKKSSLCTILLKVLFEDKRNSQNST
jgi:hypothetical protein